MKLKLNHEGVIHDDRGRLRGTVIAVDADDQEKPIGFEHFGLLSSLQVQRTIKRGLAQRL